MKGKQMGVTVLFAVGVASLVVAVWIYSAKEDNSYEKVRDGVNEMKSVAVTKEDLKAAFDSFREALPQVCQEVLNAKLAPLQSEVEAAVDSADKIKKEYEFMRAQLHAIDKRVLQQTKSIKVDFNLKGDPLPVAIISMPPKKDVPPPVPVKKGKVDLLKKSGIK